MLAIRGNLDMSVSPKRQRSLRKQSGSRLPSPGEPYGDDEDLSPHRRQIVEHPNGASTVEVTFSGSGTFMRDTDEETTGKAFQSQIATNTAPATEDGKKKLDNSKQDTSAGAVNVDD